MRLDFKDVLQAYLSYSGHYLCAHVIGSYEQALINGCVVYELHIENICLESGYEIVHVDLEDILIFLYLNHK